MKYYMIAQKERPSYVYCFYANKYTNDYRATCFIKNRNLAEEYLSRMGKESHLLCWYEEIENCEGVKSFNIGGGKEWKCVMLVEWIQSLKVLLSKEYDLGHKERLKKRY